MKNNLGIKKYFLKKFYFLSKLFKIEERQKQQKYSDEQFIFLIKEIEKMDEIFSNYSMYSALILYKTNKNEEISIEKIKNNTKNLKNFNCEVKNFNENLEIKLIKKGEKA